MKKETSQKKLSPKAQSAVKKVKPKAGALKVSVEKQKATGNDTDLSAGYFIERLESYRSAAELEKIQRYFKSGEGEYGEGDIFMGVRMGQVFALAKLFVDMPPAEIENLLESQVHEARVGAVSIMDFQARKKNIQESSLKALFDLYIRRHDRINNWDLVDRSAPHVVGRYLYDHEKSRNILYKLARSKNVWERRTSIVSTYYFIKHGDVADTFKIARILLHDKHDLIHKATGGWLRAAGGKDLKQLLSFLDTHAATMPRIALRYAIEHLDKKKRDHYLNLKID